MSSLFKSKRNSGDAKSSSKSSSVTDSDSKTQKGSAAAAPSSKSSGASHSGPGSANAGGGGAASNHSKQTLQAKDRKASIDMQEWLESECPIDNRMMAAGTMPNNTLSISRSGRFKAKGRIRARLFSEDIDGGPQDDHPAQPPRVSSTLATPEDRQTVLEAMSKRPGGASPSVGRSSSAKQGPAGGNPGSGANKKSSDRGSSSKWSTTPNSTNL